MSFEIKGLKELEQKLKQIQKNANSNNHVPFNELFNHAFMEGYTKFSDIDSFFDASPFTLETQEDLEVLPEDELDVYVAENTSFNTWQDMLGKAGTEWTAKKLGL